MKLYDEHFFLIEKEEGLELLKVWEHTGMTRMKLYGNFDAFLRVGNILRKLKKETKWVKVKIEDYYAFSINLITNTNLIHLNKKKTIKKKKK